MNNLLFSKSRTHILILFVGMCLFRSLAANRIDESQYSSDRYFKDFAKNLRSDYVKCCKDGKKLVLFAYPPVIEDVFLGMFAIFAGGTGVGICMNASDTHDPLISHIVGGTLCLASLATLYFIIKHYNIRNGFVPYLTFDSEGLQVFDKYVLDWKDVYKIEGRAYTVNSSSTTVKITDDVSYSSGHGYVKNCTILSNKFGIELYRIDENDGWLPSPVSYENVVAICEYCRATYGNDKFKTV